MPPAWNHTQLLHSCRWLGSSWVCLCLVWSRFHLGGTNHSSHHCCWQVWWTSSEVIQLRRLASDRTTFVTREERWKIEHIHHPIQWDMNALCPHCNLPLGDLFSPVTTGGLWYHYECCIKVLESKKSWKGREQTQNLLPSSTQPFFDLFFNSLCNL